MLEVRNLNYRLRNSKFEIKDINFSLGEGYLMCLLGRNGAGKSSLLRLLYGIWRADSGEVLFQGEKVDGKKTGFRQEVGYLGEECLFFLDYKVRESVKVLGGLYEGYREEEFIRYMGVFGLGEDLLDQTLEEMSTGQGKLLQLAFLMARHPRLLLLDEPMANLDPVVRVEFLDLLQGVIAREEISVVLSTHLVEDISEIVDYIGVMEEGRMVRFGERSADDTY